MSSVIREPPFKTLQRYVEQIQSNELTSWAFIRKLDRLTQREFDGEPILIHDIEVLTEGMTPDDIYYVASKLISKAKEAEEIKEKYDRGLL